MDETYIRVKGKWVYLYRAVDSSGATLIRRSEGNQGTLVAAVQEYPSELLPEHGLDKMREGVRVKEVEQRSEGGNHRC